MVSEIDYSILVSNVISENRYKHCRLCLKSIEENLVCFDDAVSLDVEYHIFHPLSEILRDLFGPEVKSFILLKQIYIH